MIDKWFVKGKVLKNVLFGQTVYAIFTPYAFHRQRNISLQGSVWNILAWGSYVDSIPHLQTLLRLTVTKWPLRRQHKGGVNDNVFKGRILMQDYNCYYFVVQATLSYWSNAYAPPPPPVIIPTYRRDLFFTVWTRFNLWVTLCFFLFLFSPIKIFLTVGFNFSSHYTKMIFISRVALICSVCFDFAWV